MSDQKINVVKHFESERNSARINIEQIDDEKSGNKNESQQKVSNTESKLEKSE